MSSVKQFCTFHLEDMLFGIDVSKIQEVIRYQPMTDVPMCDETVEGLINLRGLIVTAINLRKFLSLPPSKQSKPPTNIILRSEEDTVSLLVDKVGDVIQLNDDDFEAIPPTLDSRLQDVVSGVYKLDEQLLLILDTDAATKSKEVTV